MTAAELIERLQEFNPSTRIFVRGYEGGYDDIEVSELTDIALNVHNEWWYGKHEDLIKAEDPTKKKIEAIIIKGI